MKKNVLPYILGLALAVVVVWHLPGTAQAQGPNLDDQVNQIAKSLYCPVCPNTPLDVCSTQACAQWRDLIKQKLQQGESAQQIRDEFVQQYGQVVLGAPPAQGINWLAYILPAVGLVLGAGIAWLTVRRWLALRGSAQPPGAAPPIPREYADRIEKDLKEL